MQVVLAGGSVNYKMALAVGACHLLHKDEIMCCKQLSCWPSTLPEGVQGGGVGPGGTDLQIVRYSQKLILWAQSLYFLISRKELKSFMVATLSHDQQKLHETNRNFLQKNKHLIACIPVSSKSHIYHTSPYHFGANSQSYLRCCVPGYSPYFAPNKM